MKITAFGDLCLRIIIALAQREPQTSRELAESVGLPYNHVSKAVLRLRDMGLLDVRRGRQGGSSLTPAGRAATAGQILRAVDERDDVADCVRRTPEGHPAQVCPLIGGCELRAALNTAREAFYAALDGVVVADTAAGRGPVSLGMPELPGRA